MLDLNSILIMYFNKNEEYQNVQKVYKSIHFDTSFTSLFENY